MLSFLSPLFLIGAAAAVPIVLHLLQARAGGAGEVRGGQAAEEGAGRILHRRRLRELFLLALRVVTLVLLALAFARPFFARRRRASTGVTIVALDTSYSMSAPAVSSAPGSWRRTPINHAPSGESGRRRDVRDERT